MFKKKQSGLISFLAFLLLFSLSIVLTAGIKKLPWRVVKFAASKSAAGAGAVTKKAAKKGASTVAGVATHQAVRTAVK